MQPELPDEVLGRGAGSGGGAPWCRRGAA
jgi:hypothetical protein